MSTTITVRQWWIGVTIVTAALAFYALFPRYEWRASGEYKSALIRIDRWSGRAEFGIVMEDWGRWVSAAEYRTDRQAKAAASGDVWAEIDEVIAESESYSRSLRLKRSAAWATAATTVTLVAVVMWRRQKVHGPSTKTGGAA